MTFRHVRFACYGFARHSTNVAQLPDAFAKEVEEISIGNGYLPVQTRNLGIGAWGCAHGLTNRTSIIIHLASPWRRMIGHCSRQLFKRFFGTLFSNLTYL